jgi:hypothetical protein
MPDYVLWGISIIILGGSLVVTVMALVRVWRRHDD